MGNSAPTPPHQPFLIPVPSPGPPWPPRRIPPNKKTYQMDPANYREAVREAKADEAEVGPRGDRGVTREGEKPCVRRLGSTVTLGPARRKEVGGWRSGVGGRIRVARCGRVALRGAVCPSVLGA